MVVGVPSAPYMDAQPYQKVSFLMRTVLDYPGDDVFVMAEDASTSARFMDALIFPMPVCAMRIALVPQGAAVVAMERQRSDARLMGALLFRIPLCTREDSFGPPGFRCRRHGVVGK